MRKLTVSPRLWILAAALLVSLCGTVLAYMFRQTAPIDNPFEPAKVDCEVIEVTNNPITEKSSIKVQNTGTIDAYLRVRLVTYWVDGEGNVAGKASPPLSVTPTSDWITGPNNTFYYKSPVNPTEFTSELLNGNITLKQDGDYRQVIEVFAEAIQSQPADAVTSSWHVTLDSNGNITSAS